MNHQHSSNRFLDKVFIGLIILMGLLLSFNIHYAGLLGPLVWLFIIKAVFSVVLHKKPLRYLISVLLGLIIGPVVVCCLTRLFLASLRGNMGAGFPGFNASLLLLLLMTISFFYVRHRLLARSKHEAKDLQTNERRPVLPPASHDEA